MDITIKNLYVKFLSFITLNRQNIIWIFPWNILFYILFINEIFYVLKQSVQINPSPYHYNH